MDYRQIATEVARRIREHVNQNPTHIWDEVESVRNTPHCCPKGAFFGLYAEGWIKGLGTPKYRQSKTLNGVYAVEAARLLCQHPDWSDSTPGELWRLLHEHWQVDDTQIPESHTYQMHVLLGLWPNDIDHGLVASSISRK